MKDLKRLIAYKQYISNILMVLETGIWLFLI